MHNFKVGTYQEIVETLLKPITPSSWWFPKADLSIEERALFFEKSCREGGVILPCKFIHPDDCRIDTIRSGLGMLSRMYKLYALTHIIPHLLFRKDKFSFKSLLRLAGNILRTWLMFFMYAFVGKIMWCFPKKYFPLSSTGGVLVAMIAALTTLIERSNRWPEFAMNVLPRYLESLPVYFGKQGKWIDIPMGGNIMMSFAFGVISWIYHRDPMAIKRQFYWLISIIIGERITDEECKSIVVIEAPRTPYMSSPVASEFAYALRQVKHP